MSFGGWGALTKKMSAEKDQATKLEQVKEKFILKYGVAPDAFIRKAVVAAYKPTSQAEGFQGRSETGIWHTTKDVPSDSKSELVQAYHAAEAKGKECAKQGNLDGAIAYFDKTVELREEFENIRGTPNDQAHLKAVRLLSQRRASLYDLKIDIDMNNQGIAEAKTIVRNFYQMEGCQSPY